MKNKNCLRWDTRVRFWTTSVKAMGANQLHYIPNFGTFVVPTPFIASSINDLRFTN